MRLASSCKFLDLFGNYKPKFSLQRNCSNQANPCLNLQESQSFRTKPSNVDELFIYEIGEGSKPILLLHDLSLSYKYWLRLLPHLNQSKFKYIVPDLLGHGRSPQSRHLKYDIDSHIKYLIRDAFDGWSYKSQYPQQRIKEPVHVIGHGLGAIIALELASRFPDRVLKITIINMPFFMKYNEREMYHYFPNYGPVILKSRRLCYLSCLFFRLTWCIWVFVTPFLTKKPFWLIADSMRNNTGVIYDTFQYVMVQHDTKNSLNKLVELRTPVAIIHGEINKKVPVTCAHKLYNNFFEICELDVFKDAGHDIPILRHEELAKEINKDLL